ncbi:MAG: hypothetical protein AB1817_02435 [Chloroflexota bacterium]
MIRVLVKNQEVELTLPQFLDAVRQLKPEEKNVVRRALDNRAWSARVEDLLARVWAKVEQSPLADEEISAEVESVRQALFNASRR